MLDTASKITALITKVFDYQGGYQKIQNPCSPLEIVNLQKKALTHFSNVLSAEYLDLLQLTNGLKCNGVTVFASENSTIASSENLENDGAELGDIESIMKINYYFPLRNLYEGMFVYAENDLFFFVFDRSDGKFWSIDRLTAEKREMFQTFFEALSAAFRETVHLLEGL